MLFVDSELMEEQVSAMDFLQFLAALESPDRCQYTLDFFCLG